MTQKKRHIIQAVATLITNANIKGFFTGEIYRGPVKHICVPGLNCYSCPGAVGSCPIGSLQAVVGGREKNLSFYVVGLMLFFGVVFGRLICGFLCPFGFVQDLLHKIPLPKLNVAPTVDKPLRYLKYVILAGVFILPVILVDDFGIGAPYFCKYVCPAGTLGAGIPLVSTNAGLQAAAGSLFVWKLTVLAVVVIASMLIYRPFCKYLCPLGAFYGLLNRFSVYSMSVDENKCTKCGACTRACLMNVPVPGNINSPECIRCGKCKEICPECAIASGFGSRQGRK